MPLFFIENFNLSVNINNMLPSSFILTAVFFFGLLVGSFLNVCIWRIPRGESIVFPQSHCTRCGVILKPIDLIPVLSYLFYKFKCRYCGSRISVRYASVEILTAIIFSILYYKYGLNLNCLIYMIISSLCIIITFIDIDIQIIPDSITLTGIVAGLFLNIGITVFLSEDIRSILNYNIDMFSSVLGIIIGGGLLYIIAIFGGMGGGDVKFASMLGAFLGFKFILTTLLLSFIIGSLIGLICIIFRVSKLKDLIPFGPSIAISAFLTMYFGYSEIYIFLQAFLRGNL